MHARLARLARHARHAIAGLLLAALPCAGSCGDAKSKSLAAVDQLPADRLEIVRGDRRLADLSLAALRSREAELVTVTAGEHQYRGITLKALLDDSEQKLGLDTSPAAVEAVGADGYRARFTAADLASGGTLVVFEADGEPLPAHLGPLRLHSNDRARAVRNLRRLVLTD